MTMKVLYILRHGKSSAAPAGLDDCARPLDGAGRDQAAGVGAAFAAKGWRPAVALVSSARRTRETIDGFLSGFGAGGPRPQVEESLYLATAERLRDELCALDDDTASALLVGHNPGLHDLALWLAGQRQGAARDRLLRGFPPCAVAAFECEATHWSELSPTAARLVDVVFPKDAG
jgi:phosphohistidine phosphatase